MGQDQGHLQEILLIPLGKVLVDILEEIAVALRKTYHLHVRIGRSEEPDTAAYSDARRQFDADKLLQLVSSRKRDSLAAVLGVVDADMFSGEKTFVFGAQTPERASAVLALARLREEYYKKPSKRELFFRRAVTEAIAQIGLALGQECRQKKCALTPGASLWKLDGKPQNLCEECEQSLHAKLFPVKISKRAAARTGGEEESLGQGPEGEKVVLPDHRKKTQGAEDEAEVPGQMIEPEGPMPAELAAIRPEPQGPEEPLVADGPARP